MQVQVRSYFYDNSKEAGREFAITLTDEDGLQLFQDNWNSWSSPTKYKRLRAMADIYSLQYAASRDLRPASLVEDEIQVIIAKDLK